MPIRSISDAAMGPMSPTRQNLGALYSERDIRAQELHHAVYQKSVASSKEDADQLETRILGLEAEVYLLGTKIHQRVQETRPLWDDSVRTRTRKELLSQQPQPFELHVGYPYPSTPIAPNSPPAPAFPASCRTAVFPNSHHYEITLPGAGIPVSIPSQAANRIANLPREPDSLYRLPSWTDAAQTDPWVPRQYSGAQSGYENRAFSPSMVQSPPAAPSDEGPSLPDSTVAKITQCFPQPQSSRLSISTLLCESQERQYDAARSGSLPALLSPAPSIEIAQPEVESLSSSPWSRSVDSIPPSSGSLPACVHAKRKCPFDEFESQETLPPACGPRRSKRTRRSLLFRD